MSETTEEGARALSKREHALWMSLREAEGRRAPLDLQRLASRTGYAVNTVKTYLSKKLEGVLVFRTEKGWVVRGATRCSEERFATLMSQKAGVVQRALADVHSWRQVLRKVLYEGQRRGYHIGPHEEVLLESLREQEAPEPLQGSLFEEG
jgi:hypothetical protein